MDEEYKIKSKYVIISVMGPHAGESSEEIFSRKIADVEKTGKTFWVINSYKSNPTIINEIKQSALKENENVYCLFIEASTKKGARPTTESKKATEYSEDKQIWKLFNKKNSPVTGNIRKNSYAMVFDELSIIESKSEFNLWDYGDFDKQTEPILPKLGVSTWCGIKKNMSNHPDKIKSNLRKIMAVAKLHNIGSVWLR
jgi:lipopolysaccharide export LptBFGC system permease protein LptF